MALLLWMLGLPPYVQRFGYIAIVLAVMVESKGHSLAYQIVIVVFAAYYMLTQTRLVQLAPAIVFGHRRSRGGQNPILHKRSANSAARIFFENRDPAEISFMRITMAVPAAAALAHVLTAGRQDHFSVTGVLSAAGAWANRGCGGERGTVLAGFAPEPTNVLPGCRFVMPPLPLTA